VAVVEQGDRDLVRVLDDMAIGHDVAVLRINDHPGACALKLPVTELGLCRDVEEAAKEGIIEQRVSRDPLGERTAGGDVDHRR
jgi:hypothetical protein